MTAREEALAYARYMAATQGGEVEDYLEEKCNGKKYGYQQGEARHGKVECEYEYKDKDDQYYLRVEKLVDADGEKSFPQSHWDGKAWQGGKPKGPKIPYNLPQLIAATPDTAVYVCEGEKDADSVFDLDLLSTTNSEGAKKWTADLNQWFVGKKTIYVLQDNDLAGRRHAQTVAQNLAGIVDEVRIVALPNLPEKGDVSDWLAAGGTKEKLIELCAAAPLYKAEPLDPNDPMRTARTIVAAAYTNADGLKTLHRHRAAFWSWTGSYYQLADDEMVRSDVWTYLEKSWRLESKKGSEELVMVPFKPNSARVSGALDALEAVIQLDKNIEPPAWLTRLDAPPAKELMACGNGLLHLPSDRIYPPTPDFFNVSASEVIFNSTAAEPVLWLDFLKVLFGDDTEAIQTLQDWCGYLLAPDTSQQKILLMVGPKRSGKGTIGRIMTKLLGRNSVSGPTMSSLSEQFGLEPLITKPLAIVSDARIGTRTDKSTIVERLLSVSGEDMMTVARKYKDAWHGRLPTRFMVLTNELPSLSDGSGALAGRFIVLMLTKSFFGKEDPLLTEKLAKELPGILNWAMEGYRRLRERGYLIQPKSSQDAVDDIEMLAAPVKAFIRDYCDIGPGYNATVDELWGWYEDWCKQDSRKDPGTKRWFGRNLRSAEPGITVSKTGTGDDRERVYVGIRIKPEIKPKRNGKTTNEVGNI